MTFKKSIIAFFVIGILGTLGHFVYQWTGENHLIGLFFPVNESTWEHLKLLFFPTLIYSLFEYIFTSEKPKNYLSAVSVSLCWGMLSIVTLFYTISGILGRNVDFINILIYFVSIIVMLCKKRKLINNGKFSSDFSFWSSAVFLFITTILFIAFSYSPPSIGLFTPPVI